MPRLLLISRRKKEVTSEIVKWTGGQAAKRKKSKGVGAGLVLVRVRVPARGRVGEKESEREQLVGCCCRVTMMVKTKGTETQRYTGGRMDDRAVEVALLFFVFVRLSCHSFPS